MTAEAIVREKINTNAAPDKTEEQKARQTGNSITHLGETRCPDALFWVQAAHRQHACRDGNPCPVTTTKILKRTSDASSSNAPLREMSWK